MSSSLPTTRQRLTSMAITVLLVAVVATVVDLASDDPVQSSAATTTLAPEAEETPLAEMQGVYTFSGAAPLASITDLQQAALQSLAPGIQVSSEVVDRASATAALCAGDSSVVNTVGLLTADEVAGLQLGRRSHCTFLLCRSHCRSHYICCGLGRRLLIQLPPQPLALFR